MATEPTKLTAAQDTVVDRIVQIGTARGESADTISLVVQIANFESTFDKTKTNSLTISGLFQYSNDAWELGFKNALDNEPGNLLLNGTFTGLRSNLDAQVTIMYSDLAIFKDEFNSHNFKDWPTSGKLMTSLPASGLHPFEILLQYQILRQTGSVKQVNDFLTKSDKFKGPLTDIVNSKIQGGNNPPSTYNIYGRDANGKLDPAIVAAGGKTKEIPIFDQNNILIGTTSITINATGSVSSATQLLNGQNYAYKLDNSLNVTTTVISNADGTKINYSFDPKSGAWASWKLSSTGDLLDSYSSQNGVDFTDPNIGKTPSTSQYNLNINPNIFDIHTTTPINTTLSISNNNTLLSGGGYSVTGVGDVNIATSITAWLNDSITDNFRPGADQLASLSPTQSLSQLIDQSFSVTALTDAFNNATRGLNLYTPTDPLLLDLNGDGVHLTNYSLAPVLFDIDHDGGTLEQTGWMSAEDGMVVYDLNNNGKIDDISETLSEYFNGAVGTGGNAGTKAFANGLAALKSLDSNNDNQFTAADAAWNNVNVWVDANHDGKSFVDTNNNGILDAGEQTELKTLAELGITSINLNSTKQSGLVRDGNEVLATSTFIQNGIAQEALAASFIANLNGSTFAASGSGTITQTEGNISSYSAANPTLGQTLGETIDVALKAVNNAMGGSGDDTLIGNAGNNWLAGGLGADSFSAGAGDDVLLIDANDTSIDGGDGNDLVQVIGDAGVTLNLAQSHIEGVQGGRGDDFLYGGGNSSVFVRGGDGDDVLIGGAANDVLNGENGIDLIDGGAGNDILRGGRGQDRLVGGTGDDLIYGGQDDDKLYGGLGNDVLNAAQGDDLIDGGDGIDTVELSGSFADYHITKLNAVTYRIVDSKAGRDGADTLTHIEKLSFADINGVDITLDNPMPVKDVVTIANRNGLKLIKVADLLANDRDWQGDALHITTISDIKGGTIIGTYNSTTLEWTPTLTAKGELQFTPDPAFTGVMSFKYKIADIDNSPGAKTVQVGTSTAAEARGQVFIKTPDMPTDSLFTDEWYLNDINVLPVWQDYTGKGVSIAQFEPGMPFSTGPEVFDYRHPDLQANVDQNWLSDPTSNIPQTFSNHATLVAGVMVAARDGQGAVGVAYNAKLSGHYIDGTGLKISALEQEITDALATFKNYDVVNNSWGAADNFSINVVPVGLLQAGILNAVEFGRNGLGTAIVMAGGNDRQNGGNTNTNALSANRAVITTGAINAVGDISTLSIGQAPFSNPGASILVSAPGSNIASTSRILMGDDGTIFGNDTSITQGTSFATPIVSGVVALMLEANSYLGWRDIQQILAISARKVNDPNTDTVWNGANNWNGGGMHTSHDYGFGDVDARAAVRLAESWTGAHTSSNERHLSRGEGSMNAAAGLGLAINDGAVVTRTLAIGAGIRAEHVDVSLDLTHSNWGDLTVELIAPSGTVSKLVSNPGTSATKIGGDIGNGQLKFTFDTTHSYGENGQGNWQLRITDRSGRGKGTLNGWKVDVYGSDFNETFISRDTVARVAPVISAKADNSYFYTDEFTTAPGAARATLTDSNGGSDIINASAVSTRSIINLINGSTSTIAGRNLIINGDIEHAFGGDGNDTITGNALSNSLAGGRGNDTLNGGDKSDLLDGEQGNDTLTGGNGDDLFVISKDVNSVDTITDFSPGTVGEKIMLVGFENITDFTQVIVTQEGVNTRLGLGAGQTVLLKNITSTQLSEQNFVFFSDNAMLHTYITYVSETAATWSGDAGIQNTFLPKTYGALDAFALGGNDVIRAQTQNDLIDGGDGNDTIWGDYPGYTAIPGADWLEGGAGNDVLYGGAGNDLIFGGSGDDDLEGEDGNDILRGATGADLLLGGNGNDLLLGGAGNDYLDGGAGDDVIFLEGDWGNVDGTNYSYYGTRVGGAGADVFKVTANGGGSNSYVASGTQFSGYNLIADFDPNQTGELIDLTELKWIHSFDDISISTITLNGTILTSVTSTDGTNQLAINLYGVSSTALNAGHFKFAVVPGLIFGSMGNDLLVGDAGGNTINGGVGADSMEGRTGDDTYVVDNIGDTVNELPGGGFDTVKAGVTYSLASQVENLVLTGTGNLNGSGNELANRITGNSGNNLLDGGTGVDTLLGGVGNDIYIVDSQSDTVIENVNEGVDIIQSSVSYTLGANVENLKLTGTDAVNATGNNLSNNLTGNVADNLLDGAEGADTMVGGAGDDTYIVDSTTDHIIENLGEGIDSVLSSVTNILVSNVENLTLIGSSAINGTGNALDNVLTGNSAVNTLVGGAGNDRLISGAGNDTLVGGIGDDTYVVAALTDIITENANAGTDTVEAGITYTLGTNLENLTLTGSTAINGTGNALNNVITGNSADNTLSGNVGKDTLIGGEGNDTYVVDNTLDVVTENLSEGTDLVQSSVTYTLVDNVENLTLTGTLAINGTGNALNNVLTGNSSANILVGGAGNDRLIGGGGADNMRGGIGNDIYVVDLLADVIIENANEGFDTVQTGITYVLGANVENLTLTGVAVINGTGNALDNIITGNSAANTLVGGAGNDRLISGAGNDTLVGGIGNDTYVVAALTDIITEIANAGTDTVEAGITYTLGANLENLTLTGATAINGTGNALNNVITGNSADNTLSGDVGADILIGGKGNDIYVVDNTLDIVTENLSEGTDLVQSSVTYTLVDNVENLTLIGTKAINGTGNALNNVLTGNSSANILVGGAGNDRLIGGGGADNMQGGIGNDIYVVDLLADVIVENADEGFDTVQTGITYVLGANVENLTLTGVAVINGTGNALDNVITGNSAANTLVGGAGNDRLISGAGNDTLVGGIGDDTYVVAALTDIITEIANAGTDTVEAGITYTLGTNLENLTLTGSTAINGTGNALNNVITGNSADNTLSGNVGADIMIGGKGNDIYVVDNTLDIVTENLSEGTDLVQSSVTYSLVDNVENLTLIGTKAINAIGNTLNNVLAGNSAINILTGGAGNDTYVIGAGDIVVEAFNEGIDTVQSSLTYTLSANIENLILTGTTAINGTGNALNNVLTGNSAANTLAGGAGNDTYVMDNLLDVVVEGLNEGIDTVQSSITYTLGTNVENLTLMGTAINGTGNALNNVLTGNSVVNTLTGGAGNDTYVIGTGDIVVENLNAGTDTVQTSISYTLGANVENLTLTGATAINGIGNALNNILTGNSAVNTLTGGVGNDTYIIGTGDIVVEALNQGIDTVQTSITYTLAANVENLTLTGITAINGTGNVLSNIITGNSTDNTLNGGAGADTLIGGAGNDIYVVDNALDVVTEALNAGTDTVQSSITYTLSPNLENLTLIGAAAINGTGNEFNNILIGNSAINTLTGDAGDDIYVIGTGDIVVEALNAGTDTVRTSITYSLVDNVENLTLIGATAINGTGNALNNVLIGNSAANILTGGAGNDTYVIGTGDTVVEALNAGIDTVQSSINYILGANVENLTLTGAIAIDGTGNELNNVLTGNSAINTLTGAAGNDTLDGAGGADTLTGGTGNDTYIMGRDYGADTVIETDATVGNTDVAQFLSGVSADQLWFIHSGNNLVVDIIGTTDSLTIQDWYSGTANHVEQFKTTDGAKTLIDSNVQNLVNAMAGFAPPVAGQSTLPQNYQTALAPVIAANWQ